MGGESELVFGRRDRVLGNSLELMIPPNPPSKKGGSDLLFGDGEGGAITV